MRIAIGDIININYSPIKKIFFDNNRKIISIKNGHAYLEYHSEPNFQVINNFRKDIVVSICTMNYEQEFDYLALYEYSGKSLVKNHFFNDKFIIKKAKFI
jgi:hypothetical protein